MLFNFSFYIIREEELILKVYFIEFSSLSKTCGTQHQAPPRPEEDFGTTELDQLVCISNTELSILRCINHITFDSYLYKFKLHSENNLNILYF